MSSCNKGRKIIQLELKFDPTDGILCTSIKPDKRKTHNRLQETFVT